MTSMDNIKPEEENALSNITPIDKARFRKLDRISYWMALEEWEILRIKIFMEGQFTGNDVHRFFLLCKYIHKNGHSESIKRIVKYLYTKLLEGKPE